MQSALEIVFRGMAESTAVDANIRHHFEKLNKHANDLMSCRVTVEQVHRHHHQGNLFQVRMELKAPGHEAVVSRTPDSHQEHEDVYIAIRDAFDAARKQLEKMRKDR